MSLWTACALDCMRPRELCTIIDMERVTLQPALHHKDLNSWLLTVKVW